MLILIFLAVHFVALFSPSLLDDADSTHALAVQHMVSSHNWVTMYVDGIRYLQKSPLPYWFAAIDFHIFGQNVFSVHLPITLSVLACAILAWFWGRRAYGERAAFYAALAILTAFGTFLWTRFMIPDSMVTFFIALALYWFLCGLEDRKPWKFYAAYAAVALGLLAEGLVAPVFFAGALIPYLIITGEWRRWREMHLFTGFLVFLAIGAPWHVLAAIQNPDHGHPHRIPTPGNVHGFLWFYFINEQFLRFLGERFPHDYNKQSPVAYWIGQLVWLFPWSLFLPAALVRAWRNRRTFAADLSYDSTNTIQFLDPRQTAHAASSQAARVRFRARTSLLLTVYAVFILIFFAFSTNQEYYTWPAWFAILLLIAGALAMIEEAPAGDSRWINTSSKWITGMLAFFTVIGILAAAALAWGLWTSRHLPFEPDIGALLAHRGVGHYSLASSHLFDLTGRSFAALRLPAAIAAIVLLIGPITAWILRRKGHGLESTTSIAFTAAIFLIAAHIAFVRFGSMLSSRPFADTINAVAATPGNHNYKLIIYGDVASGDSIIFYTHHQALLAHGTTSYFQMQPAIDGHSANEVFGSPLIWGSCYPDAPHIFMDDPQLLAMWDKEPRIFLFVPGEFHDHVVQIFSEHHLPLYEIQDLSDKTLYTNRPL